MALTFVDFAELCREIQVAVHPVRKPDLDALTTFHI